MPATTITNEGARTADPDGTFSWYYYLSVDPVISGRDARFFVGDSASTLAPGGTIPFGARRLFMPRPIEGGFSPASYYIGLFVDDFNNVSEGIESNNTLVTPAAVEMVPYFATFVLNPDGPTLTVTVSELNASGASSPVPNVGVSLSLERPIAPSNEPGVHEAAFSVPSATTNEAGEAVFVLPDPIPGDPESAFRFISTLTVPGISSPLKFQSQCFGCVITGY